MDLFERIDQYNYLYRAQGIFAGNKSQECYFLINLAVVPNIFTIDKDSA